MQLQTHAGLRPLPAPKHPTLASPLPVFTHRQTTTSPTIWHSSIMQHQKVHEIALARPSPARLFRIVPVSRTPRRHCQILSPCVTRGRRST